MGRLNGSRSFLAWVTFLGAPLLVAAPLHAQSTVSWGGVAGRLSDATGSPVSGATVRVEGARAEATSDRLGVFAVPLVSPGTYRVQVTAEGFAPHSVQVLVRPGAVTEVDLRLTTLVLLDEVVVGATILPGSTSTAPDILRGMVLAGTANTIVQLSGVTANLAEKTPRQIFARLPGVFVYDMDGSGNQVNISTRGLDPHRSWELNVRQDGVLLNSDLYGYPASHYSPPMEAIAEIEVIRGTAALQYGSQYGGLVDYRTKEPQTDGAVGGESISTVGSYGLRSTYLAAGGRSGPLTYYAYLNERRSDGYREGAESEGSAQYLTATLGLSPTVSLRAQVGRSVYSHRIPGPLTDAMFEANPRQATRARNYYSPDITVPALSLDWRRSGGAHLTATVSGVFGPRNSVQFVGFANQPDEPNPGTGSYAPREVDVDRFRSLTLETRLVAPWSAAGRQHSLSVGAALSHNRMTRRQQAPGTTGTDFDLSVTGAFRRDIVYRTVNGAFYVENLFRILPAWTVVPGVRAEIGTTRMEGQLAYYDPADLPTSIEHRYPLFGIRTSYDLRSGAEIYGGWSQAYRPQILKDVIPANALERTDPDLEDSRGWTAEAGIRGTLAQRVGYDVGVFEMRIENRFGTVLEVDPSDGSSYLLRTNVGTSRTRGLEASLEVWLLQRTGLAVLANTATSYYSGRYLRGSVVSGGANVDIAGNEVESVPSWISRSGLSVVAGRLSSNLLVSHTSASYADPLNTVAPSANGAVGVVPAYTLVDLNAGFDVTGWMRVRAGVNNLFDRKYFAKRPQFYPGPGVWPSDGRSLQLSVELSHWP